MLEKATDEAVLGTLFFLGVTIAIFKLLLVKSRIKIRAIIGRAGLSGIFAMSAASVYIKYPEAPAVGVLALGGFLGVLGTEAVTAILKTKLGK